MSFMPFKKGGDGQNQSQSIKDPQSNNYNKKSLTHKLERTENRDPEKKLKSESNGTSSSVESDGSDNMTSSKNQNEDGNGSGTGTGTGTGCGTGASKFTQRNSSDAINKLSEQNNQFLENNMSYSGRMYNNMGNYSQLNQLNANLEYLQQLKQFQMNLNSMPHRSQNYIQGMDFNFPANSNQEIFGFFQKIFGLLSVQNTIMEDLKEQTLLHSQNMKELASEVKRIRSTLKENQLEQKTHQVNNSTDNNTNATNSSSVQPNNYTQNCILENYSNSGPMSISNMLHFLFNQTQSGFKYQMILMHHLEQPLYRQRNFSISVLLVDKDQRPVINSNRIPLTIALYSSENPPKFIETNTAGNQILQGFVQKDLTQGTATFDKIQIKEVTSHFRNGWIFLVIYPKSPSSDSAFSGAMGSPIDYQDIKPLILDKIMVKAKRIRDQVTKIKSSHRLDMTQDQNKEDQQQENFQSNEE